MFEHVNPAYYVLAFGMIIASTFLANKIKKQMEPEEDEYDIIKKYLLNGSPLYGYNKPKLWIHTKYEYNSRRWESFHSRSSLDLNQPYIHLTVKSIINHCSGDFNICLIDDNTFSKLIPSWDIDLQTVAEPMRSRIREQGLLSLLYFYGGIVVPNSFLCLRNLKELYDIGTKNGAFVCESINRTSNVVLENNRKTFIPSTYIMGSPKNDKTVRETIDFLKEKNRSGHFSSEFDYLGELQYWCKNAVETGKFHLINGELVGVKFHKSRKPIYLEYLLGENFLDISPDAFGIYIPEDEILRRNKYQWFSVINTHQLLNTNLIVAKYMKSSILDTYQDVENTTGSTVVTI